MSRLILALTAAALTSCVVGSAASLGAVSAARLGAGSAALGACDTNGVSTAYTSTGGRVTAVTVGGLADPGCEGAGLSLTLAGAANASIGTGGPTTIPTDAGTTDNSVNMTIAAQPNANAVIGVHVVIEGP